MKKLCGRIAVILVFLLVGIVILHAQDFENYRPISSKGVIPDDFIKQSTEKYIEAQEKVDKSGNVSERKTLLDYYLISNFNIDKLLRSGYITFNDELSNYVGKVADYLLREDPELRKSLRFYILKSPEVNAYATDPGIIFISVGLIAQIQNEAQLAFILSHEIAHYKNKHMVNSYIHSTEVKSGKGDYKGISRDLKISALFEYSKENELDADKEGFTKIYRNSDYSLDEVKGIFDVMLYSYLPIDEIDFNKSFLESEYLFFPDEYTDAEEVPISAAEDYDDSKSTHPNIKKRRSFMLRELQYQENKNGVLFNVGTEDDFRKIQKIARYELCSIYLLDRNYENAFYTAYILKLRGDTNVKYVDLVLAESIYSLAKYKNYESFKDVHVRPKKVEGSKHQLNYFFDKIKKDELAVLAVRVLWETRLKYPKDEMLVKMSDDMLHDLVFKNKKVRADFAAKWMTQIEVDTLSEEELMKMDKYERIKYKRALESNKQRESSLTETAFIDLFAIPEFRYKFETYQDSFAISSKIEPVTITRQERRLENKRLRKYGDPQGIDRLVLVNPYCYISNNNGIDYLQSEKMEVELFEAVTKLASNLEMKVDLLDNKTLKSDNIEKFNDLCSVNNWFGELTLHNDIPIVNSYDNSISGLSEKYGTKYFAWIGIISGDERKESQMTRFFSYSATMFGIPFGVYDLIAPDHYFSIVLNVVDIEKGQVVFSKQTYVKENCNKDVFNSVLFDLMNQLSLNSKSKS